MLNQITSLDVKTEGYSVPYWEERQPFGWSSIYERNYLNQLTGLSLSQQKFLIRRFLYPSILSMLKVDVSSIYPIFEFRTETFSSEDIIPEEMLEHDVVVRMSPVNRYTVSIEIKNVRRSVPKIVEPKDY